jgi:hypothetical protein
MQPIEGGEPLCPPQIGCDKITAGPADRALCEALHACMLSTHCAANDPLDCLCGTATGTSCVTAANGACREQTLAATRSSNATEAGTRFYDFAYPSGYATQEIACRRDYCGANAEPPHTGACAL